MVAVGLIGVIGIAVWVPWQLATLVGWSPQRDPFLASANTIVPP